MLFSFQMYSQSKENLYILFEPQNNDMCKTSIVKNNSLEYTITDGIDKIVITPKKNCISFLKKSKMVKHYDITTVCALINLKYLGYSYRIENKKLFLLIEKKKKLEIIEIETISFHEQPQD